jgi:hypothetical protein
MPNTFLDISAARRFIQVALLRYDQAPAWFENWLNGLYTRLGDNARSVTLDEMLTLSSLEETSGQFMSEPLAMNTVYKMLDRLGRDTSGIIGY